MLKVLKSLTLISVALAASAADKPTPRFSLLGEDSETPIVAVTFPNGHSDTLVLTPFDGGDDKPVPMPRCNFIGHLANEPEACLAMTGCLGSEDVELSILSRHAPGSGLFMWKKDGTVENLDIPYEVYIVICIT